MTYTPQHLDRWSPKGPTPFDSAANYGSHTDEDLTRSYVAIGQNRDSDALTRSNFQVISTELEELGAEIHRFGHWACGWYELVLVHETNEKALRRADEWAAALEDYPVACDDHFSELETNESQDFWESMPLSDRMEACEKCNVSIFAARRDYPPSTDNGSMEEYLRG